MPKPNKNSRIITLAFCVLFAACLGACATKPETSSEDIGLLPKYGQVTKDTAQRAEDEQFIAKTDQQFHGDRKKAAADIAEQAWHLLHQGDADTAMRSFNQAWLLDAQNGSALWGMAALRAQTGKYAEALPLFNEAAPLVGNDVDFMTDYARTIGFAGLYPKNTRLINNALSRFAFIYSRAPKHTRNLENWAKLLYLTGNYRDAWGKISLAMATPGKNELDTDFINKLRRKIAGP